MNSIIRFDNEELFAQAVTTLELDATPEYEIDNDAMEIHTDDSYGVVAILEDNGIFDFVVEGNDDDDLDLIPSQSGSYNYDEDFGDNNYHVGQDE